MSQAWTLSIRRSLMLLILAAVLPGLVILLYTFQELQENAVEEVEGYALRQVLAMAAHHERVLDNARLLLLTLSRTPSFRDLAIPSCQALIDEILALNPAYVGLSLADAQGRVLAASPAKPSPGVAQEGHFLEALSRREFAAGGYVPRQDGKGVVIHLAQPVFDQAGQARGVLMADFDLNYLMVIFRDSHLPAMSVLTMTDAAGMRLTRFPETEKYTWVPDLPRMIEKMSGPREEGAFLETGVDGVRRLYSFKRQRLAASSSPYVMFRLGIPVEHALAESRLVLWRNLSLLGLSAALSLLLAWLLSEYTVLRRLNQLVASARLLGRGDLRARTGLSHQAGELGKLAEAFDAMAESLERRDKATRQAEEEIQLLLHEKLECLDRLARCVAHEVRNPVATIGGLAKRLLKQVEEGSSAADYLRKILADTERLERIVREVREYADLPLPRPQALDLRAAVAQMLEAQAQRASQGGVRVRLQGAMASGQPLMAWVDRFLLEKAVRILLANALDAMPAGGELSLSLESDGQAATLRVADTGRGIAREDMPFLFDPFFTTKADAVGISLSIVKRVAAEHQWELSVSSEQGKGSAFSLIIPLHPAELPGAEPTPAPPPGSPAA